MRQTLLSWAYPTLQPVGGEHMSNIIDKTPPNEETLKGRIHLIGIPTKTIKHYGGETS